MDASHRPKIAETIVHETVRLREAKIGRRCEVLNNTRIEYASLGDYSYLGENCEVADAVIGKFTAIANSVRIGAPNHPMGRPSQHRFTYCPEYYEPTAARDRDFFAERRIDEQFLTLAPQVAGRDGLPARPGLVAGKLFAPDHPLWGTLIGVKRGGSHLFLRYAFSTRAGLVPTAPD